MRIRYNAFGGRFADNSRVLYDALRTSGDDHEHVWLADPAHVDSFPADAATVEIGTPECVEALESADLLIANTHTEVEWEKPAGCLYLQTWHGTPFKRIHWDVLWAPEGRLERLSRDVARWDVLLSPNATSTRWLRQAFRFDGEVLETGYPRNDVLSAPDRDARRAAVRAGLGLQARETAVLYTPTWRDDVVFADRPFALDLDLLALADELGPGHRVLVRTHYMLTGRLSAFAHPRILDVSWHSDIAELYLAADALVTDYSSTMFDFAVTGRPLLFFTPDLDDFRDRVRGFYFDLEPIAPGPVVERPEELAAALRDLDAVRARYADRYAAFRERFCHLEDGRATDRVLARVRGATRAAPA